MHYALQYCRRGVAYFLRDGRLKFRANCQEQRQREAESEFRANRGGVLFWNGARAHYVNDRDLAMFPPGCNVAFPKIGTARAIKRYANGERDYEQT